MWGGGCNRYLDNAQKGPASSLSEWDGIGLGWLSLGVRIIEPITVLIGLSNFHIRKHKWADGLVLNQKYMNYRKPETIIKNAK